jgi:hypothetical protein
MKAIQELINEHTKLVRSGNPYAYFELAYTRQTGWMAWICDRSPDPNTGRPIVGRIVLACGQGNTPNIACKNALSDQKAKNKEHDT